MSEEVKYSSSSSFTDLEIGTEFYYLDEKWVKINRIQARKDESTFVWMFPGETIVDLEPLSEEEGES